MSGSDSRAEVFDAAASRIIGIIARRIYPRFFILDFFGNVVFHSPDIDPADFARRVRDVLATREGGPNDETVFEFIDTETVLRIIPAIGTERNHVAVFIERVKHRGSLPTAAKRFHLTKREVEVLRLVVRSFTSAQIAERLYISQTTVSDHVKSLLRKTKTGKRSELIARVYDLDHDLWREDDATVPSVRGDDENSGSSNHPRPMPR